ncbi:hypothetical protein BO71DRAFT_403637 [Aspergillus ellipticus CBS 707.79]|uniref:Zn(2)-C6 fungal-type domain-containing protein n=1 Tax=Aspergillus ellipticus CBS 707.79 TaxID=1448320 RepID=A0A319DCE1_9EURO|nr:hypothetical protein BO71DRAFT_403637 [Aspergillus ellipticus CBS 707.79]
MPQPRPRRRSRRGCGNCKLRSVKCDETKPTCRACRTYGVACNYALTQPRLQASVERVMHMEIPPSLCYWPTENEYLLSRFQTQIAGTISVGRRLDVFRNDVVQLARSTPFLMHALTALVLLHDRQLETPSGLELSLAESNHWHRALVGFNRKLAQPYCPEDKGAMLSTATILWFLIFGDVKALTVEENWPLKSTPPSWLSVNGGKAEVWRSMPSSPTDSIAAVLSPVEVGPSYTGSLVQLDMSNVPPEFGRLYQLDTAYPSSADGSPYYTAAIGVARALYHDQSIIDIVLGFVACCSTMDSRFRSLLLARDARALLLLACWYAKIRGLGVWWMARRALLEGEAICFYLERHFPGNADIQKVMMHVRPCP